MEGHAVTEIARLAAQAMKPVEIDGRTFALAVDGLEEVRPAKVDSPDTLKLHSLEGLVDYLEANVDGLDPTETIVHVAHPRAVHVVTKLYGRDDAQRARIVTAEAEDVVGGFFGNWYGTEEAVIALQTRFADTEGRADALALVGNITEEAEVLTEDDGVGQTVTTRQGLTMKERSEVPNPVELAPYRSFHEVDQVVSPFIIRVRRGRETQVSVWEADGGAWKLEAVERVVVWLEDRLDALGFRVIA